MGINNFLNQVNSTIGENMRFARQFQANQQAGATQTPNSTAPAPDMLNSLMMMMLFQMLSQMMGQDNLPLGNTPAPAPPIDPYYSTGIPLQNPAYQFLNNQLLGNSQASEVDFEDNVSIQRRMSEIVSTSNNNMVHDLVAQLKTTNPTATEFLQIHLRLEALLKLEGRDDDEIQEYKLLVAMSEINSMIQQLEILEVGDPAISDRINALKVEREKLATECSQLTTSSGTEEDLTAKTLDALKKGQFTEVQLGQSLKYMLDKTPDANIEKISILVSGLMEAGELNIAPFLNSEYLDKLSLSRQTALLQAVENSGLRLGNGKPNSRFIGFMLEQLGKPGASTTKAFLQQFLQDFYDVHGQNPTTPVGQTLADILRLANIEADEEKQLIFT